MTSTREVVDDLLRRIASGDPDQIAAAYANRRRLAAGLAGALARRSRPLDPPPFEPSRRGRALP